jgi:hypothetical protein
MVNISRRYSQGLRPYSQGLRLTPNAAEAAAYIHF